MLKFPSAIPLAELVQIAPGIQHFLSPIGREMFGETVRFCMYLVRIHSRHDRISDAVLSELILSAE